MNENYNICSRCVMDTTDPNISFDSQGICNHCRKAEVLLQSPPFSLSLEEKEQALNRLLQKIKKSENKKQYDCIIGVSGGVDSTYVAYLVKKWGLRPLAVHLDNGWNTSIADHNYQTICSKLEIPLEIVKFNPHEFMDLQLAFLKSSTPDLEIPSDNGIFAVLWAYAIKYNVKYILTGYNKSSESILPTAWSQGYFDRTYIGDIYKKFGTRRKITSFKILSNWDILYNIKIRKIHLIPTLDYIQYDKEDAKAFISENFGWINYGRKHGESFYTKFIQEYILPHKFGFDKRKAHYSSLIISNQMTRDEARNLLEEPLYLSKEEELSDIHKVCEMFGVSIDCFNAIMSSKPKKYSDYKTVDRTLLYKIIIFLSNLKKKK